MKEKQKTKCDELVFNDEDEPYLLKIDWDWIPPNLYIKTFKQIAKVILLEFFGLVVMADEPIQCFRSKSKNGLHWYIKLFEKISDEERCLIQFMLGDDKKRCKLNWQSIQIGLDDWNKFYEDYYYRKVE